MALAFAAPVVAQAAPSVILSRSDAEFAEPFDQVTAGRELRGGRVVVADLLAKGVSLADFRTAR